MANHWAIAIGINQYQFLQPLRYAQQDAQALRDFWVDAAEFGANQCLLLTDTSPPLRERSTEPTRFNIQLWWNDLCEQLQPDDLLWCFFSGCGVCHEGQDYLMPIDGNPDDIPGTAISMRSLLEQLAQTQVKNALVLLDMNRSQGLQAEEAIGVNTIDIASKLGIPMVLACEPGEFSHEVANLHHSCFTAALLEGLRCGKCDTLGDLDRYLRDRLPELTEHYWQPAQHAVTVVSQTDQLDQAILPSAIAASLASNKVGAFGTASEIGEPDKSERSPHQVLATINPPLTIAVGSAIDDTPEPPEEMEDAVFWRRVLLGGGALVLLLLVGVVLRNLAAFTGQPPAATPATQAQSTSRPTTPVTASSSPTAIASLATPATSPSPENSATATSSSSLTAPLTTPATAPSPENPTPTTSSPSPTPPTIATNPTATASPTAIAPTTAPTSQEQANQELLDKARVTIRPNQASRFNQAIAQASQIKRGEPLYEQAQQDIERWSRVILDLAQGRAKQGQFAEAVTTARLVPKNNAQVYGQAQTAIAQWQQQIQQQQANQTTLAEAQNLLRRGSASSYNRAINLVQKIPADQPGYDTAQQRAAEWSKVILGMAQLRASRGNLTSAVQTAKLVPPNTPAYAEAQKAIATWSR